MIVSAGKNQELGKLLDATGKAKPARADLAKLHAYLDKNPEAAAKVGNLALQLQINILDQAYSSHHGFVVTVGEHCSQMREGLGYDGASMLEQMLIEHIIVCWLRLHDAELRFEGLRREGMTTEQGLYWERKLSANQRRFLRSVETLARVRRLLKDPPPSTMAILLKQQLGIVR